ncbi:hypothetical protein AMJ83_06010 [candidate division WOR_3 bacterium SM23_42]|uniref:DNA mismatch repair protein MutL n=1 Tax=candidate division WOR_3 bacterium SM23_42 TaxID=1703779 RepID=A0A0S8FU05_UNCW3|nr:MAG: hypothetical protein AMJ83_06010 [candidate division WOR_3 bacterium SM23_42]
MSYVHILNPDVRSKIAAGEVIARPASVVKELLENSLDAQAKRIDVEIIDGGKEKCLVNDDGKGMDRSDAQLALERYSTSKIASIDDIERIQTFGFRGEALASIAYVSKFEMETSDGLVGTTIIAEAGSIKRVLDSERPRGTRIKVSNLFFNLPARLKFLKSEAWERRLTIDLIKGYAVAFPSVSFSIVASGREILNLPPGDSMHQRARALFSGQITDRLTDIDFRLGTTHITGILSRPDLAAKHKLGYVFVNSRPVKYPRVYRTIVEAFHNPKYPPAFAIDIRVDPKFVDTNIHPTKSEVKFKDERYILDILSQVIKREIYKKSVSIDYDVRRRELAKPAAVSERFVQDAVVPDSGPEKLGATHAPEEFWQLHNTYILAQTKSGMIIVDQHVAHERIIYESIMKGRVRSQRLLFPITIELTPEEHRVYEKTKHVLTKMGIEFKEFSARTVVIDSLPADVRTDREEIAGLFGELNELGDLVREKEEIARVVACRGSIKSGQKLSPTEMQSLIDRLFATENPYTCPHGRPIVIRMTVEELAHKFGRS